MALEDQQAKLGTTSFLLEQGLIPASDHEHQKRQYLNQLLDFDAVAQDHVAVRARGGREAMRLAELEFEKARNQLRIVEARLSTNAVTAPIAGTVLAPTGHGAVIAQGRAGASSAGTIDPLEAMADYCEAEGIWLHVDAAYGGFAVVTERGKELLRGIERADSIGLDAHKWFFQPYEARGLLVKDVGTLERAFVVHHDILQDTIWGGNHPNFSDRGLQLSRACRALKIWMSVQTFGMAAFRRAVSNGMELAARAEAYVEKSPVLELLTPASLGIVCFRVNPSGAELDEDALEKINRNVLARVFWEDSAFMSSTMVYGKFALRLCIINHNSTWDDVRETLEANERFGTEALQKRE